MLLVAAVLLVIASAATGESTSDGLMTNCCESASLDMPERNASCGDIAPLLLDRRMNAYGGERGH